METSFHIMPLMCTQQKQEIEQLLAAADDIGAAASATHNGMGYEQLMKSREKFKDLLMEFSSHYRIFKVDQ